MARFRRASRRAVQPARRRRPLTLPEEDDASRFRFPSIQDIAITILAAEEYAVSHAPSPPSLPRPPPPSQPTVLTTPTAPLLEPIVLKTPTLPLPRSTARTTLTVTPSESTSPTALTATPSKSAVLNIPTTIPSSQKPMSFTMSQGSQGGLKPLQGYRKQYNEPNGSLNPSPQIYSAVYSGVDVYEMEVKGVAVMRRRNDSWLNATQILKVAGIDKGKRTKVLEKEILIGEHEKVQGGYGKYQGTWIKFERGVKFCEQYEVEQILRPLLTYDMGQNGGPAGRGGVDTPTKEQAMAAQRKKLYNASSDTRLNGQAVTFFKNISSTASTAVAAISKARYESPAPRRNGQGRPTSFSRQSSQQRIDSQESVFPGNSQQSMQSFTSDNGLPFGLNGDSAYATQSGPQYSHAASNGDFQEPPPKRIRPSSSVSFSQPTQETLYDMPSPTEPNESFIYHQNSQLMTQDDTNPTSLPALPYLDTPAAEAKRALMISLFMDPSRTDFSTHQAFLTLGGEDLDIPIDPTAHTALHWAATLARMPLLRLLIARGANMYRVNSGGETALMRACVVTNNLDIGSFPDLLELLGPTIEMRDYRNRTVLHQIALTSAVKGRSRSTRYYLECLLEFVVRQGSTPNSQQAYLGTTSIGKSIGIGRFMSEVVNVRDYRGDTALHIASRIGNQGIISQLLEVGGRARIGNRAGLRPADFGIGDPAEASNSQDDALEKDLEKSEREDSGEIIDGISKLVVSAKTEFAAEVRAKQAAIDALHASLREQSAILGTERQRLEQLLARKKARDDRKIQISNLTRATQEERVKLNQMLQNQGQSIVNGDTPEYRLGDADIPFLSLPQEIAPGTARQHPQLIASLPTASTLKARLNAYETVNRGLETDLEGLKKKSHETEEKYRRVISICTGTKEEHVDAILPSLNRAVESEGDLEVARVREFLRKVGGAGLEL